MKTQMFLAGMLAVGIGTLVYAAVMFAHEIAQRIPA